MEVIALEGEVVKLLGRQVFVQTIDRKAAGSSLLVSRGAQFPYQARNVPTYASLFSQLSL